MPRGFGPYDGGAGDLLRGAGIGSANIGPGASERVARWQNAVGTVTKADLAKLGIGGFDEYSIGANDPVDTGAMKFQAMKALHDAQSQRASSSRLSSGGYAGDSNAVISRPDPVAAAQQQLADAEMASAGADEVLRLRQQGFNKYGNEVREGMHKVGNNPYDGQTDPGITAQTGAALASGARAGRPSALPEASRPMSASEHFAQHPSYAQFGTPGAGIEAMTGLKRARRGY